MIEGCTYTARASMVASPTIYQPTKRMSHFTCEVHMVPACPRCSPISIAAKADGGDCRGPHCARTRNMEFCRCLRDDDGHQRWHIILRDLGVATPDDWIPYAAQYATLPPVPAHLALPAPLLCRHSLRATYPPHCPRQSHGLAHHHRYHPPQCHSLLRLQCWLLHCHCTRGRIQTP